MNQPRPSPPIQPSGFRKVLKVVGIIFGVLLLAALCFAFITIDLWHIHFGYGNAAARYRASGMPWTEQDLQASPIPAERNAAPKLLPLLSRLAEVKQPQPELGPHLLDEEDARKIEAYMRPKNALIDEYRPLAGMLYRQERGWEWVQGPALNFAELATFKALAKDLAYRSELRSFRGDIKGSIQDLKMGASLARQAGSDGFLISYLVEIALRAILCQSARKSASYHLDDPEVLEAYAAALDDFQPDPSIARSLKSEAYLSLTSLRNMGYFELIRGGEALGYDMDGGPPRPAEKMLVHEGDPKSFMVRSLAVPLLEAYAEAGEIMKSEGTSPETLSKIADMLAQRGKDAKGLSGIMANTSLPIYKTAFRSSLKARADRGTVKAALQIAALRARKGSLTQAEIDALIPIDPYTNKPMKASAAGKVIKVWSVGEDLKDNGGASMSDARFLAAKAGRGESSAAEYDLVTELPWRSSYSAAESANRQPIPGGPPTRPPVFPMPW